MILLNKFLAFKHDCIKYDHSIKFCNLTFTLNSMQSRKGVAQLTDLLTGDRNYAAYKCSNKVLKFLKPGILYCDTHHINILSNYGLYLKIPLCKASYEEDLPGVKYEKIIIGSCVFCVGIRMENIEQLIYVYKILYRYEGSYLDTLFNNRYMSRMKPYIYLDYLSAKNITD